MFTQARKEFRENLPPRLKSIADRIPKSCSCHGGETAMTRWLVDFWTETEDVPDPMVRMMLARLLQEFGIKMEFDGNAGTFSISDDRMEVYRPESSCFTCGHADIMDGCVCCDAEMEKLRKEGVL